MRYSNFINMKFTLNLVEKQLKQLTILDIEYRRDGYDIISEFYDDIGIYDAFYFYLDFNTKDENYQKVLNEISNNYIKFDLLYPNQKWASIEVFENYQWVKKYKLHIQATFNKEKYFNDNKKKLYSIRLKSLIQQRKIHEYD